jgi:hypothetical protein
LPAERPSACGRVTAEKEGARGGTPGSPNGLCGVDEVFRVGEAGERLLLELVNPLAGEPWVPPRWSAGGGAVGGVVEVAPWSRIPETRALVVPRDV